MDFRPNPAFERQLREKVNRGLKSAGEFVAASVRANIDSPGPPASKPGQFPNKDTGTLHSSIKVVPAPDRDVVEVKATAPYARSVETKRPYLWRSLREAAGAVLSIIARG